MNNSRNTRLVRGETLIETLVSILIATLAVAGLTAMLVAAVHINDQTKSASQDLQKQSEGSSLQENEISSGTATITYNTSGGSGGPYNIVFYGDPEASDGVVSYKLGDQ